jgi:uncharacterized protein involved in exopolysaccharide biosynthesis
MKDEIDLLDLVRRIWNKRRLVVMVAGAAMVVGVVVALVLPRKYTATSVMVPHTESGNGGNALGGLAAMAGVNLGGGQSSDVLTPTIYPQIVASVPFQKELMRMPVYLKEYGGEVMLLDYFAEPEEDDAEPATEMRQDGIEVLTPRESAARSGLSGVVSLSVDAKSGEIRLSATMPEPLAAAQVAKKTQELLHDYITKFKVQKVQATLDFIEERTEEARAESERTQDALAAFRDRNRNIVTATAQIGEDRLQNENDLAFAIYSDLMRKREQTRIELKETTPVITVIEPVTVPDRPSAPKRKLIVAAFTFLGLAIGCILALALPSQRQAE